MSFFDLLTTDAATAYDSPTGYDSPTAGDALTAGGPTSDEDVDTQLLLLFAEYPEGIAWVEMLWLAPHLLDTFDAWAERGVITCDGTLYVMTDPEAEAAQEVVQPPPASPKRKSKSHNKTDLRILEAMVAKRHAFAPSYAMRALEMTEEEINALLDDLVAEGLLSEGDPVQSRGGDWFRILGLTEQGRYWADRQDSLEDAGLDFPAMVVFEHIVQYFTERFFTFPLIEAQRAAQVSQTTAGTSLKRLEAAGYVERGEDRRPSARGMRGAHTYRVTDLGRAALQGVTAGVTAA